jgi:hypothetical protein
VELSFKPERDDKGVEMKRSLGLFVLTVALLSVPPIFGADKAPADGKDSPADALKIENEKGQETTLTQVLQAKLSRQSAKVKDQRGNEATYEGVSLAEVLKGAGVTLGKELRGPLLANCLLVEAADGYRVVLALPEVDPELTDKVVLLADRKDGNPLGAEEGPYRLIVPGDKRNMRWVTHVTRISVRSVGTPAPKDKPASGQEPNKEAAECAVAAITKPGGKGERDEKAVDPPVVKVRWSATKTADADLPLLSVFPWLE